MKSLEEFKEFSRSTLPGRLYDLEKERRRILRNVYLAGAVLFIVAGAVSIFTHFRLGETGKGDL